MAKGEFGGQVGAYAVGQAAPSPARGVSEAELVRRFTHQQLNASQQERAAQLRAKTFELAREIATFTPPGREQSLALTALEECAVWTAKAIARGET